MTNNNNHHFQKRAFSGQSYTMIEQQFPTPPPVPAVQHTNSGGVARLSRHHPLNAGNSGISRVSARQPAIQRGEWLIDRPLHKSSGLTSHIRYGTNAGRRPDTPTNHHTSAAPDGRGVHHHPEINPTSHEALERPLGGVLQDKYAQKRVRRASLQAVTAKKDARTRRADTKSARVQKQSKRQTVQVAAWIKPALRAELETIARKNGLTLSRTIATLLEEAIRQQLHVQHAVLLQPIIEQAIARQMRSYSGRIAILLVRSLFASEQTRSLVTNILGRQQGITQPVLREILNSSGRSAKRNITQITPQLAALVEDIKTWMEKEEAENKHA